MRDEDWYRNRIWSSEIESEFNARLARAKDKGQYLRIQASYIATAHPRASLGLIDRFMALGDHWDLASAFVTQADAWRALGDNEQALSALRNSVVRERDYPKAKAGAALRFGCLVAVERMVSFYDEALAILDEQAAKRTGLLLPRDRYEWHAARALILQDQARPEEAEMEAKLALEAAASATSGFESHPSVGLVQTINDQLGQRVRLIAVNALGPAAH